MRFRQIGNAWSERENKRKREDGGGERGVVFFFFFFFWGVQWPWKMLVGFFTALEEVLMRALQPPSPLSIIKPDDRGSSCHFCRGLPCRSVIEQNTESLSSFRCLFSGWLWPLTSLCWGQKTEDFPYGDQHGSAISFFDRGKKYKTAAASNYF